MFIMKEFRKKTIAKRKEQIQVAADDLAKNTKLADETIVELVGVKPNRK